MLFPRFQGFVRVFVIACAAVFALEIFARFSPIPDFFQKLIQFFGLTPSLFFSGMVFQPLTWLFFHRDPFHLLFNMFGFWMFGSLIEETWGTRKFTSFVLWSGFLTGLGVCLFSLLPFEVSQETYLLPTIGASGVVFAILIAVSRLFPDQMVLFFFVFPMKMRWFAYLMIAFEFYALYSSNQQGVSNIAHLSGAFVGFALTGLWMRRGGSSSGGGAGDWLQEIKDRLHQRKMRKRIRIIRVNDKQGNGPTYH